MDHPGRLPPFDVYLPPPGTPPPLRVSHLEPGQIVLLSGDAHSATAQSIAFSEHGPRWANPGLRQLLADLNTRALPFQHQPHVPDAPAALMAWWQETGQLPDSFHEFSWRGPGDWLLTRIPPPQRGVLGWAGPQPYGH